MPLFLVKFPGFTCVLTKADSISSIKQSLGDLGELCEYQEYEGPVWVEFAPPALSITDIRPAPGDELKTQFTFDTPQLDTFHKLLSSTKIKGVTPTVNPEPGQKESEMQTEIMKSQFPRLHEYVSSGSRDKDRLRQAIREDICFQSSIPGDPVIRFKEPATAESVGLKPEHLEKADQYWEEKMKERDEVSAIENLQFDINYKKGD